MDGLNADERDLLAYVKPDTLWGALRSKLMASLAQRFGEARLDSGGADLPAFS